MLIKQPASALKK